MNSVCMTGRLTRDPEYKVVGESSTSIATMSIAVQRPRRTDEVDYFDIKAFGKTAEFISKYFTKGMKVEIGGHLQTDTWEDDEGKKHYKTFVYANDVGFAESKK